MKKLTLIFLVLIFKATISHSMTIDYICTKRDSGFIRFYKIDANSKSILYYKSKVSEKSDSSNKGEVFFVNLHSTILDWDFPNVWSYQIDKYADPKNYIFEHFNFKQNLLTIVFMKNQTTQKYDCF